MGDQNACPRNNHDQIHQQLELSRSTLIVSKRLWSPIGNFSPEQSQFDKMLMGPKVEKSKSKQQLHLSPSLLEINYIDSFLNSSQKNRITNQLFAWH